MTVSAYATTARARTRGGAPPQRRTSTLQRCPNASTVLTVLHPVHPAMDLITIRNEKGQCTTGSSQTRCRGAPADRARNITGSHERRADRDRAQGG